MTLSVLDDYDRHIEYSHLRTGTIDIDFHLHERCEIYFLISGDVRYFVEKNIYAMAVGDLIVTNPGELHKPTFQSDATYERVWMHFDPRFIARFNDSSYDLLHCFYGRRNGENNKIPLTPSDSKALWDLLHQYENILQHPLPGLTQLKLCRLLDILVFLNQRFDKGGENEPSLELDEQLSITLDYIDSHLAEDLSLRALERDLFINRYYLCKLFKRRLGNTVHEYITYKRVAMAKACLSRGMAVGAVWEKSGFTDYTSFLRAFKRTVGMLPKDYCAFLRK